MEVTDFRPQEKQHGIDKAKTDLQGLSLMDTSQGEKGDSGLMVLNLVCYWITNKTVENRFFGSTLRDFNWSGYGIKASPSESAMWC